jgi:hypothetical protein
VHHGSSDPAVHTHSHTHVLCSNWNVQVVMNFCQYLSVINNFNVNW